MPKRNAFWFFMRELMDEMRNDGVEVSSFAEVSRDEKVFIMKYAKGSCTKNDFDLA